MILKNSNQIGLEGFLNMVFKHPKLRIVTQTLLNKHSKQTCFFFFFWVLQFLVFKYWKLFFEDSNPLHFPLKWRWSSSR